MGFRQKADALLKRDLAGLKPQIVLGVSTKDALKDVGALQAKMQVIADKLTKLRIGATSKDAEAVITRLQARLLALTKQLASITLKADTTKLDADLARELAKAADLKQQLGNLQMKADNKKALSQIADLELAEARLEKRLKTMKGDLNIAAAQAKLADISARLAVLNSKAKTIVLKADMSSLRADLTASTARVEALKAQAADIRLGSNIDASKLFATDAGLVSIEAAMEKLKPAAAAGDIALGVLGKALTGTGTGWGFLTRGVTLFGGAFNKVLPVVLSSVAVWHVLTDAIIEIGAVWIPASLAVGAFAVAASDAAVTIQRRMQAVHTVMDATGQSIPPMTNALENLHKAVQPQVYQLFGDALRIMNSRQGTFAQVAKATGTVLDQLGARITYAITSTGKLGTSTDKLSAFWKTAISDVTKLGDSIGNVFGIFGNLFKAIPGFASGLLTIGDDFTKILEAASAAIVPLLSWILLLHGYILYTGLAVTATLAFIGGLANLAKQFVTFAAGPVIAGVNAIKSFATIVASIATYIASGAVKLFVFASAFRSVAASEGLFAAVSALAQGAAVRLGAAMAFMAANPLIGLAIAAAALGALVYALSRAKDSAQSFNDTMQQTIAAASLGSVASVIQSAQAQTSTKLAQSTTVLNKALAEQGNRTGQASRSWGNETSAVYNASKAHQELVNGMGQLDGQSKLVSSRFSDLTGKYGSSTAALGLLNAAGITGAQITSTQGHAWAQALIQIDSTVQAYKAMGTQAGTLGNDLDVLGRTATDQYQAVQKLNGAWSAFISDVTGTQGTFDTVVQGFSTLSDHSGKLVLTLGKLKATYKDAAGGATLNASLASSTAAVATAQNSLNKLQASGKGTALQLTAAHARLAAAQDRLTAAQLNLSNAQNQGKAAIDALTPAGVALNQAFGDQVGNLDKLFASWRTAGLAGDLFTAGVKNSISPMLKYAAGSQEATAQLVALAEEAGYQGPISFQALVKWLGNTHGALKKVKDITNQATEQEALLTGAMQAQGNFIANKLLGDINQAILSYSGVEKAVTNYGTAVAQSGKDSSIAQSKMTGAINAIVTAEASMGDNASQMAAIVAKTFGISMPDAMGRVKQSLGVLASKTMPGAQKSFETFAKIGLHKTQGQAHDLWNEIATELGPHLDALGDLAGGKAKDKFIDWAEHGLHKSKSEATSLWQELVKLQGHIDALHGKNVGVNFVGSGTGSIAFKESIPGVTTGPSSSGILGFHAAGGFISGGIPWKDSVMAMLMPGEVVVPTGMVNAGAVDHLRGKLPGFAAGGLAGSTGSAKFTGLTGPGGVLSAGQPYMGKVEAAFGQAVESAFAKAVIAKFKKDMNSLGGNGSAIVSYARSFLGKIPYVFGGNSLASGIDCSGFTQAIYGKFGIHAPRTSEAQYAWATKSSPVPGSLAFYVSPAGGPPPGHVAIVQDAGNVISQGGGMGPTMMGLHAMPLMGTGVPKGGLPSAGGGFGNQAILGNGKRFSWAQLGQLWDQAGGRPGAAATMASIAIAESGGDPKAHNPSGATGLWQILGNPFPGNAFDPLTNAEMAVAKYNASGFYPWVSDPVAARLIAAGITRSEGGLIPRMAAGGSLGAKLAVAQAGERAKYSGLEHAFAAGPAKYRTASTVGELHTLTTRQAAEQSAYAALFQGGASQSELSHLGATARAVATTARDKALNRLPGGHPGFGADLRRYAGQLSTLSASKIPANGLGSAPAAAGTSKAGSGAISSGEVTREGAAWLKAWQTRHGGGFGAAWGPVVVNQQIDAMKAAEGKASTLSHATGLTAAQHRHYAAVAADEAKRLVVLNRELTVERSYRSMLGASDTTLTADINAARGVPSLTKNVRTWQAQITRQKGTIAAISKMLGYSDAQIAAMVKAGTLGPGGTPLPTVTHTYGGDVADTIGALLHSIIAPFARGGMAGFASGGMATFDNGGTLVPGANAVWNGTGANEHLVPAGQPVQVEVVLSWAGDAPAEVVRLLRKHVKSSGGNVQRALGQQGTVSGGANWKMGWSS